MSEKKQNSPKNKKISRRDFISTSAALAATLVAGYGKSNAFAVISPNALGGKGKKSPNDKLNIAGIGVGGMGKWNIANLAGLTIEKDADGKKMIGEDTGLGENIVALCDVDFDLATEAFNLFPQAKRYRDYRKMLDNENIDAVMIATPDHSHATIAAEAMRRGKHVYVQKPLTYTVKEARVLTELARKTGVATQMGNQGHSNEDTRLICEWIWDGAIGPVREVHLWTNRAIWPQGIPRPTGTPPVPPTLDWDQWIGPAPFRAYHPAYTPRFWRGWWDFGTGALGDMGCHIIDPAFWALKLGAPSSIEASSSKQMEVNEGDDWGHVVYEPDSFPKASIVHYQFPARGNMPPVKMHWYDGGLLPDRPDDLEPGRRMGDGGNGVIFVGDKGKIMCGGYGYSPRLIPETKMKAYKRPEKTIPRVADSHEMNWVRACKGGPAANSNFEYSGPMTEMVLLGNLALRFTGQKIEWDSKKMKVTNVPEANAFVHREYRKGWKL